MSDTDRSRVDTQTRGYNLRSKTRDEHAIPAASRVVSSPIRDDINCYFASVNSFFIKSPEIFSLYLVGAKLVTAIKTCEHEMYHSTLPILYSLSVCPSLLRPYVSLSVYLSILHSLSPSLSSPFLLPYPSLFPFLSPCLPFPLPHSCSQHFPPLPPSCRKSFFHFCCAFLQSV